jgi:NADPH:quinone reductase-like Zn-dependent oxidoreductase
MSIPSTAREYRLPEFKGIDSLTVKDAPVSKPKSNEVLVKVGAVSLNFRDLAISTGNYPLGYVYVFRCHARQR